jgi:3-carboxy-cis,cis-muconate cycloisomerase
MAEAVKLALAPHLGAEAHARVEQACRAAAGQRRHLRAVLAADPQVASLLPPAELERLFDPARYLGASAEFVARALARHAALRRKR